ncbi:AAA family ATPase [uncultured Thiodictyon sp.]|jgi:DNA-binding transcriptional ArsR family regulator|uniref:AAA family ATPase n=1 Tax=uncultured Thiodictyon sp. TaxID=1846217 RepID=UPI0025EC1EE7|nr:AAA family ATPase [uncultured Thiodictyon sp.]
MPAEPPALTATVKYNPHLWGPAELRAIFVVRTRELEDLLRLLRGTAPEAMPQHLLITGARGMGKTTLLRRLALAVEDDPALAAGWVPVTFPEEQYTVSTLAELWRNVLDALADTRERQGAPAAELDQLDREIARIGDLSAAEREGAALASLDAWVRTNERRLLLLIDSTDLLLANLAGTTEAGAPKSAKTGQGTPIDGGATPLWRLRKTLSHDSAIFWLGASYQSLESNHAYQDAFWDFFQLIELRALTVAEMREAMLALARTFGAGRGLTGEAAVQEMARNLDTRPERLKALRAITGGNPRTTVMLYELFAAGGADDVHSDLRRLLDTMTPLYKARMETLSDQARKLLAHLMEHWAPISARGLGEVSGIATNTVSGQLARLEAEGLVEKARLSGTKRTGYQAAERLFNVWYLMRYASRRLRQRLTWLVEFMRLWFSGEELTQLAHSRAAEHANGRLCCGDQLEYSRAVGLALPDGHAERYRLLQSHLWLGNRDLARQALDRLAETAAAGNRDAFARLKEQAQECHGIGLGSALRDLMTEGTWADFLQPFALALGAAAAADPEDALAGAPPELRTLAEEVLADLRPPGNAPAQPR